MLNMKINSSYWQTVGRNFDRLTDFDELSVSWNMFNKSDGNQQLSLTGRCSDTRLSHPVFP